MSRQRYEQVPQRNHREEVIILDSIHNLPTYNFNSGIPNSISSASSTHTPSIIAPSIPDSPPPSFHTHSPPGTPRPTPSTSTRQSNPSYVELWGVAPSTVGGAETEGEAVGGTSNDALATIAGLKQRIEWLEESIGKLLIEKDSHVCSSTATGDDRRERDNCCVTFTDASPDLERILVQGKGSNCCVSFRRSDVKPVNQRHFWALGFCTLLVLCITMTIILSAYAARGMNGRGNASVIYEEGRSA